ncbi:MAG: YtxH domain-containing protein [Pedobacter sp.]|nr:YtxH domain-containing protein [Chitinophagaceae bacterium]
MTNNQKFISGLFLGAAAGAALAIFFSSDKGKKLITEGKTKLQNFNSELDKLLEKGNVYLDEMESKISEG